MTADELLNNALSPLVDGRAYSDVVPIGTRLPHIRYIDIGGTIHTTLCDDNDVSVLVQIDVTADTSVERRDLKQQVQAALKALPHPVRQTAAPQHLWNEALDGFRVILTYSIF